MGRTARLENCKVCGEKGKKLIYYSKSKGRTYQYFRFVHRNGVSHYFRVQPALGKDESYILTRSNSVFDVIEEIVRTKMRGNEMRFGEIKNLVETTIGKPVSTATLYRNINKLLKLELISKRTNEGVVYYTRKTTDGQGEEMRISSMSIGFDFSREITHVTMFIHIRNTGLRLITGVPVSIPVGEINELSAVNMRAYDHTKEIVLTKENIAYSYPGRTGISLGLNRSLRKSEEEDIFLNFGLKESEERIKINILFDVDILKVSCDAPKDLTIEFKKILVDGVKEIVPEIVRRSGTQPGRSIVEAEFDDVSRGDTIVVTPFQNSR
ncbi:MAG: hypothetical protein M1290_01125 [Candidatus Thermoplasmatota archaeon]|jgi:hypothetical protein|nr:hypothetical protein [Candidatus Thermoplasmatota archaeon]MCL5789050.1 hypothetical protein [Candidatus Thermoplasmatota archaeon]